MNMFSENPLLLFSALMIFVFFVWIAQGGQNSPLAFGGPFITGPQLGENNTSYGPGGTPTFGSLRLPTVFGSGLPSVPSIPDTNDDSIRPIPIGTIARSPYSNKVNLENWESGARRTTPQDEYLVITTSSSNTENISLSGFTVQSARTGRIVKVPLGTELPRSGIIGEAEAIIMKPGDKAYIMSGRSPIGASFRINMCIGYFSQYQDFTPGLPRSCPTANDELERYYQGDLLNDEACTKFTDKISQCSLVSSIPPTVSYACKNVVDTYLNYNGCVTAHQRDTKFYSKEWRVYLGSTAELWRQKNETIWLLDAEGKFVDQLSY